MQPPKHVQHTAHQYNRAEHPAHDAEVNHERTNEALENKPQVIATGCPFCNTMITDGVKNANQESEVEVKDIAELIAEAADLLDPSAS